MSHAFKARRKAIRKAKEAADPERREVKNFIRRGKAPRLTRIGMQRIKYTNSSKKWLYTGKLVYTFGLIFDQNPQKRK